LLFHLLLNTFLPRGPVILGVDGYTIERLRGKRISAKGIYRDPMRSSEAHFVKASALCWTSLMVLALSREPPERGPCRSSPPWRLPNGIAARTRSSPRR
jgi:hypothetical protein